MKLNILAVGCLFSVMATSPGFAQPPTAEASKAQASLAAAKSARVKSAGARLMTDATSSARTITTVKAGTVVQVLGSDREWLRVRVPGVQQEGFVLAADVELIKGTPTSTSGAAKGPGKPGVGVRAVLSFGQTSLTSAESFDAVAGQHTKMTFGVGAEVVNLWKGLFAGAAYSPLSLDGQQVFVDGGPGGPSGIPVTTSVNSLDVVGGWRFTFKSRKPAPPKPGQKPPAKEALAQTKGPQPPQKPPQKPPQAKAAQPQARAPRLVPFVGGGLCVVMYKESSADAAGGGDVSEIANGFVVLGGVEYTVARWLRVGGEFRYRAVNGVLGSGGLSQVYGENSVGGYAFGVRVVIGR
jgi:opacity protein-like surface antigen